MRTAFAEKLRDYGWVALEEVWVTKYGTHYRADVIGSHPKYESLGFFLFELKASTKNFGKAVTKAHKQIVYRYIGSHINDYRYPYVKETPQVYVYYCPYTREQTFWSWRTVVRFFNRYGIGLIFADEKHIILNPASPSWSRLCLNPDKNTRWLDLSRLKTYLEHRTFGFE